MHFGLKTKKKSEEEIAMILAKKLLEPEMMADSFEAVWQADPTDKKTPDQKQNNGTTKDNKKTDNKSKKAVNTGGNSLIIWMVLFILSLAEAVRFRM